MRAERQATCDHRDWMVYDNNCVGYGTCKDCGKEISLVPAINDLIRRVNSLISQAQRIIDGHNSKRQNR